MFRKKTWIPILSLLVIAMGCGLFYGRKVADQEPVTTYKPVEVQQPVEPKSPPPGETAESGHWHGDVWHAEPHAPTEVSEQPPLVSAVEAPSSLELADAPPAIETPIETETDFVNPTSTSSNPLFADGVPEHLQCPPEFIGGYFKEGSGGTSQEIIQQMQQIGIEIVEQWNPNRPLTEVWTAFMVAERWCHDNADPEQAGISMGANRMDWQLQLLLDFPEIGVLFQEDLERAANMHMVELGYYDPDHNQFTLPDGSGRTFRTDEDKKYVFTSSTYTETEDGFESSTSTSTLGPSNGDPNAEVIEINLDTITDEELEALSGWNYNINPYTTGAYKLGDHR